MRKLTLTDVLEVSVVSLIAFVALVFVVGLPAAAALVHSEFGDAMFYGLLAFLTIWCAACAAVGFVAQTRERNGTVWFLFACLLTPPFAAIILGMLRSREVV